MYSHTLPTTFRVDRVALTSGSVAWWARREPNTCVIFVHGFGGRAVSTWGSFPDAAVESNAFATADLIFLGYESLSCTASFSAAVIYRAVAALAEKPSALTKSLGCPDRQETFDYDKITLVGHSLGGAIVRDVPMTAKDDNVDFRINLSRFSISPWSTQTEKSCLWPVHYIKFHGSTQNEKLAQILLKLNNGRHVADEAICSEFTNHHKTIPGCIIEHACSCKNRIVLAFPTGGGIGERIC